MISKCSCHLCPIRDTCNRFLIPINTEGRQDWIEPEWDEEAMGCPNKVYIQK